MKVAVAEVCHGSHDRVPELGRAKRPLRAEQAKELVVAELHSLAISQLGDTVGEGR